MQSISVKAGSTPLPAIWALETSRDTGSDFEAIHYYAADQEDCSAFFGAVPIDGREIDEDPVCLLRTNSSWEESENVSNDALSCPYFKFCFRFGLISEDMNPKDLVLI